MNNGPTIMTIVDKDNAADIAIASDAVVYTKAFPLNMVEYFSIVLTAVSDGAVKLKVELQQSHKLPETEGSADDTYVVMENGQNIVDALADEAQHIYTLKPICLPYGRLKITGLGAPSANDASTVLNAQLGMRG